MADLDARLRDLFDTPAPVSLHEAQARRSRAARPGGGRTVGRLARRRRNAGPGRGPLRVPVAGRGPGRVLAAGLAATILVVGIVVAALHLSRSATTVTVVGSTGPPPPVTVTLHLDRTIVPAGSTIEGQALVDDTTGRVLAVRSCPSGLFVFVSLTGGGYSPLTGGCDRIRLTPGVNHFPFDLSTTAELCTQARGSAGRLSPRCGPGGRVPPLSPGTYPTISHVSGLPRGSRQAPPVDVTLLPAARRSAQPRAVLTLPSVGAPGYPSGVYPAATRRVVGPVGDCPSPTGLVRPGAGVRAAALAAIGRFARGAFDEQLRASDRTLWPQVLVGARAGTGRAAGGTPPLYAGPLDAAWPRSLGAPDPIAAAVRCSPVLAADSYVAVFGQADRLALQGEYVVLDRRGHLLVYLAQ